MTEEEIFDDYIKKISNCIFGSSFTKDQQITMMTFDVEKCKALVEDMLETFALGDCKVKDGNIIINFYNSKGYNAFKQRMYA